MKLDFKINIMINEEFDNNEPLENQSESNPQDSAEQSILQNRLDLSHIRQGVDAIKA